MCDAHCRVPLFSITWYPGKRLKSWLAPLTSPLHLPPSSRISATHCWPLRSSPTLRYHHPVLAVCFCLTVILQGFMLLKQAAVEYKWSLQYGNIALMWRGGCIIRSVFLGNIKEAYDRNPSLPNLMLDPWFTNKLRECSAGWRRVVALGALSGVPTPCFSSALSFYDSYRHAQLILPFAFTSLTLWCVQVCQDLGQSHPGPARLFRRTHLRTHRQAAP